ncbi:calcium-dependent protein kinase, putative [Ricinus communis]|uniref:Calcium-dependent protein kinase, putative n=1 Tax=Ricinus communis TaxID=3988 RepID=B9SDN8_RICCO|nr:calcium-dependent protein kinase, putative [Ricinus communis]
MLTQIDTLLIQKDQTFYFRLGRKIDEGRYRSVFLCVEKATRKEYACKLMEKQKMITNKDVKDLMNEIQIMQQLTGNPNVTKIQEAYEDDESVYIVMELCKGGSLLDRIKKHGRYSETDAAKIIRTIAVVVQRLHSLGVMHRVLEPENILFLGEQEDSPLKIIHFGFSTFFKPSEKFSEIAADIWSIGVILYILLTGVPPFWAPTEKKIEEEVLHGDLDLSSDSWPDISEIAKELVRKMLDRNPATRITTSECWKIQLSIPTFLYNNLKRLACCQEKKQISWKKC